MATRKEFGNFSLYGHSCEFSFGILVMIPHSWQGLGDLQTSARTFTA